MKDLTNSSDEVVPGRQTSKQARSLRVLVVDDNIASGEMMGAVLRGMGHTVDTAGGGEEAIRRAAFEPPDVVLMDIRMPDVDGYEAARRIKTLVPQVIVIAMSGYVSHAGAQKARAAGCDVQLAKPIDPVGLGELLERLFASEAQH